MEKFKWVASDYMDMGKFGVLDNDNRIILGISLNLTKEQCKTIADAHNYVLDELSPS